ncbi:uncharacterized protein PGTG_12074 [Puccinia graminis f. sp. tritici CRL 75-36-700-3]|uniref:Uncharacterized protein n=1 Tax=Puccinia graminis f. sp. tritici (strain CRL 75-36-700-3 / race SCCL) TaxID=418459 RepID=E3KP93_PUCGT|nr:uncharacterized protein PGTG_12074 [Puccinia graminis f. sp. tritici CRL 75-36-700-3]EFP86118.1 hypothetical protein PGTG_12074 [Puccinia graminis f. sp. tritici CRL 75-36-700-3]
MTEGIPPAIETVYSLEGQGSLRPQQAHIPMHKADSSQDYDQPGHHDTIQRGDASQLHYGQLAVAAARSVTQTFQVKLKPHATNAMVCHTTQRNVPEWTMWDWFEADGSGGQARAS